MTWLFHALRWLVVHLSQETGTSTGASRSYNFWSGFGSDLGEATLLVAFVTALRHLNCGAPGCWRVGKHPTADRMHRLCRHHHPDLMGHKRTLNEIHQAHDDAKETK